MKKTILTMLNQASENYGDKPYLYGKKGDEWQSVNFNEALEISRALGISLIRHNVAAQDRAILLSEGRPEWVLAEIGLFNAAAISVPLSIKLQPEEIPFRVNHSGSTLIILSRNTKDKILGVYNQFETKPSVLYLDDDKEGIEELCRTCSLVQGETLLVLQNLLDEGRALLADSPDILDERLEEVQEDTTVNICYTSGTTGNPKGIMLTHLNYWANCEGSVDNFRIPFGTSTLVMLPVDHSFAHTVALYTGIMRQMSLWFVDAQGGNSSIVRNIPVNLTEANPTFLLTVPALTGNFMKKIKQGVAKKGGLIAALFFKALECGIRYNGNGYNKPSLAVRMGNFLPYALGKAVIFPKVKGIFGNQIEYCVGGGALLDVKQQEFFNTIGVPVYQGYGLTEAAPVICSNTPHKKKFGTSGLVLPNVNCRIVLDDGSDAPVGIKGQIVIQGDNVMKGYYNNPEATAEVLKDGWLYTGDLGYYDEDEFLVVTGREKALLISREGEKYSPEEIEEAICNCSDIIDQCMLWCDHANYTTVLVVADETALKKEAAGKNLTDPAEVLKLINEEVNAFREDASFKGKFPAEWLPSDFRIVTEPFTEANKMINSTMKMVRYRITEAHQDLIDDMYGDNKGFDCEKNRKALEQIL